MTFLEQRVAEDVFTILQVAHVYQPTLVAEDVARAALAAIFDAFYDEGLLDAMVEAGAEMLERGRVAGPRTNALAVLIPALACARAYPKENEK